MRVALDTNILVYAAGVNGAERADRALLSEHLHPGFVWRGVEVRRPF